MPSSPKLFYARPSSYSRRSTALVLCLLIGLSGLVFGFITISIHNGEVRHCPTSDCVKYEPPSHLLGKEYFLHAYGPIYALSADVVSSLVALRNNRIVFFCAFGCFNKHETNLDSIINSRVHLHLSRCGTFPSLQDSATLRRRCWNFTVKHMVEELYSYQMMMNIEFNCIQPNSETGTFLGVIAPVAVDMDGCIICSGSVSVAPGDFRAETNFLA